MQPGDAVLGAPASEGLVALEPDQGLGADDAAAGEGGDVGGVAGGGEVDHDRGDAVGLLLGLVARLLPVSVLRPGRGGGADVDASVFGAACQGAGGELVDHAFRVRAQGLEDVDQGLVAGGGDHVLRVFPGLKEDGDDDPRGLGRAVGVGAQGASDVLDDVDLGAARADDADRFHSA